MNRTVVAAKVAARKTQRVSLNLLIACVLLLIGLVFISLVERGDDDGERSTCDETEVCQRSYAQTGET
jgi:hypothetical protein